VDREFGRAFQVDGPTVSSFAKCSCLQLLSLDQYEYYFLHIHHIISYEYERECIGVMVVLCCSIEWRRSGHVVVAVSFKHVRCCPSGCPALCRYCLVSESSFLWCADGPDETQRSCEAADSRSIQRHFGVCKQ